MSFYHCISELILQWKLWKKYDNPLDAMRTYGALVARYTAPTGDIIIGKIVLGSSNQCYIYYPPAGINILVPECEYLVEPTGYSGSLVWEPGTPGTISCGALPAGRSADGTDILYIALSTNGAFTRAGSYSTVSECNYQRVTRYGNVECNTMFSFLLYRQGK